MDQPMPPEMAAMPPDAMPPEGMPPEAMPTSPDDVVAAVQQQADITAEMYLSERPSPDTDYDITVVQQLVNELNKLLAKVNDRVGQMVVPPVQFEAPAGQKSWNQPLPDMLWLNVMAVSQAAVGLDSGRFAEAHGFDPKLMVSTGALRQVSAKFRMMARDAKFIESLASATEGAMQPPEATAPDMTEMQPEAMPPEDDMLLQEAV